MIPSDITTQARNKYNAASDTFFSDAIELYGYIYQAELDVYAESPEVIESTPSTVTMVNGTRIYNYPSTCGVIKRIEYTVSGGSTFKLEPITFREDDALTLVNVASTTKGIPQFYEVYNNQIYLRPIPNNSIDTMKVYFYGEPASVTSASQVLELPTVFHMDLVDYVVGQMYAKDQNVEMAEFYTAKWTASKKKMKEWARKKKRGDAFTVVMNEDNLAVTLTGPV